MVYVALLRGINVGGHNKVEMKQLKATFESIGLRKVVTYINSGNIIFEDNTKKAADLVSSIEQAIKTDFLLDIKVILRSFDRLQTICQKLPKDWVKNEIMRTDILFLWDAIDLPNIVEQLPITKIDNVIYTPGAILWNVLDKNYDNSGMLKLMTSKLSKSMTIRNVNTFRKIFQIMETIKEE
ncbi:MAG TPA: DUF1697 domain-containing protein [Edaphocola sp.]|nr:DUF1697 domain-containing protein [Edaphocola sp.]